MAIRSRLGHLGLEELLRGGLRANLVLNRHAGHVEEHHHQAAVLVLEVARFFGSDLGGHNALHLRRGLGAGLGAITEGAGAVSSAGTAVSSRRLVIANADRLRFPVLGNDEILGGQRRDRVALFVLEDHVFDYQVRRHRNLVAAFDVDHLAVLLGGLLRSCGGGPLLRRSEEHPNQKCRSD